MIESDWWDIIMSVILFEPSSAEIYCACQGFEAICYVCNANYEN